MKNLPEKLDTEKPLSTREFDRMEYEFNNRQKINEILSHLSHKEGIWMKCTCPDNCSAHGRGFPVSYKGMKEKVDVLQSCMCHSDTSAIPRYCPIHNRGLPIIQGAKPWTKEEVEKILEPLKPTVKYLLEEYARLSNQVKIEHVSVGTFERMEEIINQLAIKV